MLLYAPLLPYPAWPASWPMATPAPLEMNCTALCWPARPQGTTCNADRHKIQTTEFKTHNAEYRMQNTEYTLGLTALCRPGRPLLLTEWRRGSRLQSSNELQLGHVMARNCRLAISGNQLHPVGPHCWQQCSPENQNLMTATGQPG